MSKQAVPEARWAEMQGGGAKGKVKKQGTLDGAVQKVKKPARFTPAAILLNVTKHVVCHDQVSLNFSCDDMSPTPRAPGGLASRILPAQRALLSQSVPRTRVVQCSP